ncbi:unnamed protein product, partial [Rotaria sordida]
NEDIQDLTDKNNVQQQDANTGKLKKQNNNSTALPNETSTKPSKSMNDTSSKPQYTANETSAIPPHKPRTITKTTKRNHSPNSSTGSNPLFDH